MALHTHLPIHKLAYDLLGLAVDLIRNMPRDIKLSLGAVIREECIHMLLLIAKANAAADKTPHILELLEARETVELLLRTCVDKRFISRSQWARAVEMTESIGKQAGGWRKQSERTKEPEQPSLFAAAAPVA
jgi:hypothetical protein